MASSTSTYDYSRNTRIGSFLDSCNKRDREKLIKVLASNTVSSSALADVLTGIGCPVSARTVREFRQYHLVMA